MKPFHDSNRRVFILLSALVIMWVLLPAQAPAETVTWDRKAYGQVYLTCPNPSPPPDYYYYYWPNNNNWSQAEHWGPNCDSSAQVMDQPSNWTTPTPPNGASYDVIIGGAANLNMTVTLHSLTMADGGSLSMQFGTTLTAGSFEFQGNDGIVVGGGGGGWPVLLVDGPGTITRSAGSGTFAIDPGISLTAQGATVNVNAGMLVLPGNGSTYSNCTFAVAAGSVLDLVPSNQTVRVGGVLTGTGGGTMWFHDGGLSVVGGTIFDFAPGLFQWTGGSLSAISVAATNIDMITVSGNGGVEVIGALYNAAQFQQIDTASVAIHWGSHFDNLISGVYELQGDESIVIGTGGGGWPIFNNAGVLRKSGGTGTSEIGVVFNNTGTVDVQSGRLAVTVSGGVSSNVTFHVAEDAVFDLTGGSATVYYYGLVTGTGTGRVEFTGGQLITTTATTFNFEPEVFQWSGGWWQSGSATNIGMVSITGTNYLELSSLRNAGKVVHAGTASVGLRWGSTFENLTGGTYEFTNDGSIVVGGGGGGWPVFNNAGLLRKSGGTGTSTIVAPFANLNGTVAVDCGKLSLGTSNFAPGTGTLAVKLAGTGPGQFGQLQCANASLSGTLHVTFADGYVPASGAEFQVLACNSLSGTFAAFSVPPGITVSNANNGVFLTYFPPVPEAPIKMRASAISDTEVFLQWKDMSDNEAKFKVKYSLTGTSDWVTVANVISPLNYCYHSGLTPGITYFYKVRAQNPSGTSGWSNIASATPLPSVVPPLPPTDLTATLIATNQVLLTWNDNSTNESGFRIQKRQSLSAPWGMLVMVGANMTNYVDKYISPGITYYYRVKAYNASGNSDKSNVASVAVPSSP